jgi:PhnB protein
MFKLKEANMVKPIPDGYHSLTPYLCCRNADKAIEFYKKAFGAEELFRMPMPDGKVGHAELQFGNSRIMLADEFPDMPDMVLSSPDDLGGSTMGFNFYVPDVDAAFRRAVDAGAMVRREVKNQFYGDRSGTVQDPFGHTWTLSTHVEDLSPEEMKARMEAAPQG